MRWSPGKLSLGQWQVVVVCAMVGLNALMLLFFLGGAATFSRHAEVLDDVTVDACAAAALADRSTPGIPYTDIESDFDGTNVLRIRYRNGDGVLIIARCQYSLPADGDDPPEIESVSVVRE